MHAVGWSARKTLKLRRLLKSYKTIFKIQEKLKDPKIILIFLQ